MTRHTCDAAQSITNSEDYEGMLVTLQNVRSDENQTAGQGFFVPMI